jgi:hypothetical protein
MIRRRLAYLAIAALLLLELPSAALAKPAPETTLRTVTANAQGLTVSWQTPEARAIRQPDDTYAIQVDGIDIPQTPGAPQLPEDSLIVALPDGPLPVPDISIQQVETTDAPGSLAVTRVSPAAPGGSDFTATLQRAALRLAGQPSAPITLEEIGVARGVHLARLTFRPVRLLDGRLETIRHAQVTLRFTVPVQTSTTAPDDYLATLARTVANPTHLLAFQDAPRVMSLGTALTDRTGQAAIEVSNPGLTAVTYEALAAASFPVNTVDPHLLHLERAGVEIAAEWEGDSDNIFEAGERILFYAQPRFSRWTARDVYFLSIGATPGSRMSSQPVDLAGKPSGELWLDQLFEQNTFYTPDCYCAPIPAGRDGDRWVWDTLRQPDLTSASYPFDLGDVSAAQPAKLTLWLISYTDLPIAPDHRVEVTLNGSIVDTLIFDGKQAYQAELTLPAGLLKSGGNTLTLSLPGVGSVVEGIWLDAFTLHYARSTVELTGALSAKGSAIASRYPLSISTTSGVYIHDITNADAPVRLSGAVVDATHLVLADPSADLPRSYAVTPAGSLLAPANVRMSVPLAPNPGANYLVITPPDFAADLKDLITLRKAQGLTVLVQDVRAIYDAADGRPQPEAIRSYLANVYANGQPRTQYVLLVGDGTSDPRGYLPGSPPTWIPPYLVDIDPVMGETAADNRYAAVDGQDNLPDLMIGRLPVNSHVEAAIMLTKIVQYQSNSPHGPWSRRFLLIADRTDANVGDFPVENQTLVGNYLGSRYTINQLAYQIDLSESDFHQTVLDNWNQGNGLVLYNGHASKQQWGADLLLHINDLPTLSNTRLPVLLEMTCLTSSFQAPGIPTLDETLLRRSGKGITAAWGSTGFGLSFGHMHLAQGFLDEVMANQQTTLGQAALAGKVQLSSTTPVLNYLLDLFTLLGDPAAQINFRYDTYLPAVKR